MSPHHTRRLIARLLGLLLLIQSFPIVSRAEPISAPTLIIGEINWAGSSRSTADEWVELWNVSNDSIVLDGYRLLGAGGANGISFSHEDIILPHQTFLIANYAASDIKSVLDAGPNMVTTTISLPNDRLALELRAPDGLLVDQAGTDNAPAAGTTTPRKTSMIRVGATRAGTETDAWISTTSSINIDAGVDDLGTPGWCDRCTLQTADPLSFSDDSTTSTPPNEMIVETTSTWDIFLATSTAETADVVIDILSSSEPFITPTTSTDLAADSLTTSTDDLAMATSTTTTTSATTTNNSIRDTDTTTTSAIVTTTTASSFPATSTFTAATITPTFTPRLNEIMAAPADSAEWVELIGVERDDLARLEGWTIEDAVGVIFRFTSTTIRDLTFSPPYLQINLPGHHLNNTGDYVGLRNAERAIVDHTTYPKVTSEESWIRLPDASETWRITRRITPANENVLFNETVLETPAAVTNAPTPPASPPAMAPTTTNETHTPPPSSKVSKTKTTHPPIPASDDRLLTTITSQPPPPSSPAVKIATTTSAKPSSTVFSNQLKAMPTIQSASLTRVGKNSKIPKPMASNTADTAVRARLTGTVASVTGLLNKNQFIILADDGRGLLIKGNAQQPTPSFQQRITLTGALVTNDDGVALTMAKRDRWTSAVAGSNGSITPRSVNLLAPSTEDTWSLVEVSGTVRGIQKPYVNIETADASVSVHIRPVTRYRMERLQTGDVISVRGLLEPGAEETRILPRNADEIRLIEHAPVPTTQQNQTRDTLPPWTPFGAAGLTVALTQGVRRFKKIQEQRHLQKILEQTENQLTASL